MIGDGFLTELKVAIVARKDLKLSAGKLAAQVAHAAVTCAVKSQRYARREFDEWYGEGQKKVVLKAARLDDLFSLKEAAERAGLTTALIQDAGHTELPPGTITVLGIGPADESLIDRISGHLQLY